MGIALLIATLGGASNASSNNNGILSGRYVGATSGLEWFTPTGGEPTKVDLAVSSIGYFDGKGTFFGYMTVAAQFTAAPVSLVCKFTQTGSYTLNSDDTGTMSVQSVDNSGGCDSLPQTFNIYATQGGSKICFTQTNMNFTSASGTTNSIVVSGCYDRQ